MMVRGQGRRRVGGWERVGEIAAQSQVEWTMRRKRRGGNDSATWGWASASASASSSSQARVTVPASPCRQCMMRDTAVVIWPRRAARPAWNGTDTTLLCSPPPSAPMMPQRPAVFSHKAWKDAVVKLDIQALWRMQRLGKSRDLRALGKEESQTVVDLFLQNCDVHTATQSTVDFCRKTGQLEALLDEGQLEKLISYALRCETLQTGLDVQGTLEYVIGSLGTRDRAHPMRKEVVQSLIQSLAHVNGDDLKRRWLLIKNVRTPSARDFSEIFLILSRRTSISDAGFVLKDLLQTNELQDGGFCLLPFLHRLTDHDFNHLYSDLRLSLDQATMLSVSEPFLIEMAARGQILDAGLGLETLLLAGVKPLTETYEALALATVRQVEPSLPDATRLYGGAATSLYRMVSSGHVPSIELLNAHYRCLTDLATVLSPDVWKSLGVRWLRAFLLLTIRTHTSLPAKDAVLYVKLAVEHGEMELARSHVLRFLPGLDWARHTLLWTTLLFASTHSQSRWVSLQFKLDLLLAGLRCGCTAPPTVWVSLLHAAIAEKNPRLLQQVFKVFASVSETVVPSTVTTIVAACCRVGESGLAWDFVQKMAEIFKARDLSQIIPTISLLLLLQRTLQELNRTRAAEILELMNRWGREDPKVHQLLLQHQFALPDQLPRPDLPMSTYSDKTLMHAISGCLKRDRVEVKPALAYWNELVRRECKIHAWVVKRLMSGIAHVDFITGGRESTVSPVDVYDSWRKKMLDPAPPLLSDTGAWRSRRRGMPGQDLIRICVRRARPDWAAAAYGVLKDDPAVSLAEKRLLKQVAITQPPLKAKRAASEEAMTKTSSVTTSSVTSSSKEEFETVYRNPKVYIMSA